jgi:hypothetical protein
MHGQKPHFQKPYSFILLNIPSLAPGFLSAAAKACCSSARPSVSNVELKD